MIRPVYFTPFLIAALIITGCSSYTEVIDDDVYVVGSGVLPVGETMTDETSYAHYRDKRTRDEEWEYFDNRGVFYQTPYLGFSPYHASAFYPYWNSMNCFYGNSWSYGYGWDLYNSSYWNPYYGMYIPHSNGCFPFGMGYPTYYSPYYFGSLPYVNPGAGSPSTTAFTNQHNGPRGSWVSTVNPENRPQTFTGVLKSSHINPTINATKTRRPELDVTNRTKTLSTKEIRSKSPLIHAEELTPRKGTLVDNSFRTNHQENYRVQERLPSKSNYQPIRQERGYNPQVNRQAPISRPTRTTPTPGRRL